MVLGQPQTRRQHTAVSLILSQHRHIASLWCSHRLLFPSRYGSSLSLGQLWGLYSCAGLMRKFPLATPLCRNDHALSLFPVIIASSELCCGRLSRNLSGLIWCQGSFGSQGATRSLEGYDILKKDGRITLHSVSGYRHQTRDCLDTRSFSLGLPSAALCMWGSTLANAALFALVFPAVCGRSRLMIHERNPDLHLPSRVVHL